MAVIMVITALAVAFVVGCTQIPDDYEPLAGPSALVGPLRVSPPYARIRVDERKDFEASGGDGKYEWKLAKGLGTLRIAGVSGRWYSYQSSVPEEFSIVVRDGTGQTAETFGIVVLR